MLPYDHERVVVLNLLRALAAAGVHVSVASWETLDRLLGRGCYTDCVRVIVSVKDAHESNPYAGATTP